MIRSSLAEAAEACGGSVRGGDTSFFGVSTDSRSCGTGQLFVALRGPQFDGHHFLSHARDRGVAAAMVESGCNDCDLGLPLLRVDDTRHALGRLAAAWRNRFDIPVVAITGSNGKTTVNEMVTVVARRCGEVLATRGNLNNDIGLPLTLLELGPQHRFAVVEMGASHAGEIALLAGLAQPRVGVVTCCAPAHLEGFGSVEGVARAKGELYEGLPADGVAIINADDAWASYWRRCAGSRSIRTFALDADADYRGRCTSTAGGMSLEVTTPAGEFRTSLALLGAHNARNAVAATAVAHVLGVALGDIAAGLASVAPVPGRLQVRRSRDGACIIDDSYNANPASLAAALEVLAGFPSPRWLVLGDMAELGAQAPQMHRQAGYSARRARVDALFAVGDLARESVAGFGDGGRHFCSRDDLCRALKSMLSGPVTVLVKGSRSARMDEVVRALVDEGGC